MSGAASRRKSSTAKAKEIIMDMESLEHLAQKAAETRLARAWEFLDEENDGKMLNAPFCGCDTCVVREVVLAAWPYLYRLANHPDVLEPDL